MASESLIFRALENGVNDRYLVKKFGVTAAMAADIRKAYNAKKSAPATQGAISSRPEARGSDGGGGGNSSDSSALAQFRSLYGRNPTSSEIRAYRAGASISSFGKSSGKTGGSGSSSGGGSGSNIVEGFGGMKQWEAIEKYGLGPSDVTTLPGNEAIAFADADKPSGLVGSKLQSLEDSINKLSAANASMLRGEIPADVSASIRRAAGEASIAGGTFGSAARAMTARDLGRTSMDVKQQGIANEQALLESRASLAAAHESIRQYNLTRNATLAELSIKAREQNLTGIDIERQRIATNIDANIKILEMISNMAIQQQNIAATAAASDVDPGNIIASLDNMIAQFNSRFLS